MNKITEFFARTQKQWIASGFIIIAVLLGVFVWQNTQKGALHPFRLGLDLSGGSRLVYKADVTKLPANDINESMASIRDIIDRRVNSFGVSEPIIATETSSFGEEANKYRLSVELPGITDVNQAIETIGKTPILEFKTEDPKFDKVKYNALIETFKKSDNKDMKTLSALMSMSPYVGTDLTGKYLKRAQVQFDQTNTSFGVKPIIGLEFNDVGKQKFADITKANIGKTVAIFLDGQAISTPVVQTEITDGNAIITGSFSVKEAKELVGRLNSGALPVPISLMTTETIGPALGADATNASTNAGIIAFIAICIFLIIYYRFTGVLAAVALIFYGLIMLTLFILIPITLTASGIAAFIISLGIAVDANILISERIKEEINSGRTVYDAVREGFVRAWTSIRDANFNSLIAGAVLFFFGTTVIKGFAVVFILGTVVSMFSAITVCRYFMLSVAPHGEVTKSKRWLYGAGFTKFY